MIDDFWNLFPQVIFGREGDEDGNEGNDDEGNDDDDQGDPDGDDNVNNDDAPKTKSGKTDEDIANLEKALAAERRTNKIKERELKKLQAAAGAKQENENEDLESTKKQLMASNEKAQKLAAGLLKTNIDAAIRRAAEKANFIDVDDAIAGIDRSALVYDQDEEDPSDIDIDFDSVTNAVNKLAKAKKHFIRVGTDDGEPSGSAMGGSRRRQNKPNEVDELKALYPRL